MLYRLLFLTFIFTMIGCSPRQHDKRLVSIDRTLSYSPVDALQRLDSIDYATLPETDRYYYDFLTLKAKDKCYIEHTSDSTILKLIDYYSEVDNKLYFEALYYGGRVYSDMGDKPTALQYFHQALDNYPEDTPDLDMKANILSQTGRLLTSINLFNEAVPYIEEAIAIDKQLGDTLNMVYDIQLLGGTYLRARELDKAELQFNKAIDLSNSLPPSFKAKSRMSLAEIKYQQGELDSALVLIRGSIDSVRQMSRNNALAYASKIYLMKGAIDTAYIYSYELLHSPDPTNKGTAYHTLLSPSLRNLIPLDTIDQYISEYRGFLENYYDSNKMQLAINEQNFYNYQLHERERIKAEKSNARLIKWILGISLLSLLLAVAVLYYKNKVRKTLINLHIALKNIDTLNQNMSPSKQRSNFAEKAIGNEVNQHESIADDLINRNILISKEERDLREELRTKLLSIYSNYENEYLSPIILRSEVYQKLQELIKQSKVLSFDDPLFDELEKIVIEASPKFKENLHLLTQSRLTTTDIHTAILIKCHIQPSQMATLLGRTKSTIVSRRESLSLKIFGEKMGTKVIDGIIRLL